MEKKKMQLHEILYSTGAALLLTGAATIDSDTPIPALIAVIGLVIMAWGLYEDGRLKMPRWSGNSKRGKHK